ncbi:ABC transporter substrate-binding protein [Rhodococcus sp. Z13]|uniref:ABC transporter substrate-binding protein n=1 Tax=Rhodococcus sacchari TaxID=2962047 RepID=A0ACD4DC49_9NOCA|nr:ABC transporter substrate-binding protein [Rhodococcus sp. Z13]UYP17591.1 ABC transporter substrate-binding protein [Rhodococcus sp. Z13]
MRRALLSACALVLLAVPALTACSGDTEEASATSGEAVTVEHSYGTTTIEGTPERIVATSSQWLDALLELGIQPVGYYSAGSYGDDRGLYPWQTDVDPDAVALGPAIEAGQMPVEEIAALEPDLVLGAWQITSQGVYDRISQVAPTVGPLGETGVDRWDEQVRVLGEIFGRTDEAEGIIADRNADIEEAALPGLEGRTAVLAQYLMSDQQFVVVANPDDGAALLFSQLGMVMPPELVAEGEGKPFGRVMLAPERVDALAADLLVILPNGGTEQDLMALPGFDLLPAVTGGGLAVVDYPTVVAFNTPSSLSIGYALDAIRPQLETVGGA